MLRLVALSLTVLVAGCVTVEVDSQGNAVKRGPSDEIVLDSAGRLIVRPTRIIPATTIIVNGGTPTEREVRLLGVEGLPESEAPITYSTCQEYLAKYVAAEEQIYVKPSLDSDLKQRVIWGIVYVQAYEEGADGKLELKPDAYWILNQAMLSRGLVRMRNPLEFADERLRNVMIEIEKEAKAKKLGLWSDTP